MQNNLKSSQNVHAGFFSNVMIQTVRDCERVSPYQCRTSERDQVIHRKPLQLRAPQERLYLAYLLNFQHWSNQSCKRFDVRKSETASEVTQAQCRTIWKKSIGTKEKYVGAELLLQRPKSDYRIPSHRISPTQHLHSRCLARRIETRVKVV